MFDTHAHLNFKRFKKNVGEVIEKAHTAGVTDMLIPGTDIATSKKAIEVAEKYDRLYAAVGVHPHHAFEVLERESGSANHSESIDEIHTLLDQVESLLSHPKAVAVGEVGMDRHVYEDTKYEKYAVDERFITVQRLLLVGQVKLAISHNKSLVLHNREAKADILDVLEGEWDDALRGHAVFHCCEADEEILVFARAHDMYIGIDGDVTYDAHKQAFIKKVPLKMLVVETDSPFILPEPLLSQKKYPNEPSNISLIVQKVAEVKGITFEEVSARTTENGHKLFDL